jgi:hypothetical protein
MTPLSFQYHTITLVFMLQNTRLRNLVRVRIVAYCLSVQWSKSIVSAKLETNNLDWRSKILPSGQELAHQWNITVVDVSDAFVLVTY